MKKLIAIAALAGGLFAAAPTVVLADSDFPPHCAFWPWWFTADCRAAINDAGEDAAAGGKTIVGRAVDRAERLAILPLWWECEPASGGPALFECSDEN